MSTFSQDGNRVLCRKEVGDTPPTFELFFLDFSVSPSEDEDINISGGKILEVTEKKGNQIITISIPKEGSGKQRKKVLSRKSNI